MAARWFRKKDPGNADGEPVSFAHRLDIPYPTLVPENWPTVAHAPVGENTSVSVETDETSEVGQLEVSRIPAFSVESSEGKQIESSEDEQIESSRDEQIESSRDEQVEPAEGEQIDRPGDLLDMVDSIYAAYRDSDTGIPEGFWEDLIASHEGESPDTATESAAASLADGLVNGPDARHGSESDEAAPQEEQSDSGGQSGPEHTIEPVSALHGIEVEETSALPADEVRVPVTESVVAHPLGGLDEMAAGSSESTTGQPVESLVDGMITLNDDEARGLVEPVVNRVGAEGERTSAALSEAAEADLQDLDEGPEPTPGSNDNLVGLPADPRLPLEHDMSQLDQTIQNLLSIDGAIGAAVVDLSSGMALAQGGNAGYSLEVAAAGNANVIKAKLAGLRDLGEPEVIEDILITLEGQYHLINMLQGELNQGLFIFLALNRASANLALARHKLGVIARAVSI